MSSRRSASAARPNSLNGRVLSIMMMAAWIIASCAAMIVSTVRGWTATPEELNQSPDNEGNKRNHPPKAAHTFPKFLSNRSA